MNLDPLPPGERSIDELSGSQAITVLAELASQQTKPPARFVIADIQIAKAPRGFVLWVKGRRRSGPIPGDPTQGYQIRIPRVWLRALVERGQAALDR